MNDQPSALRRFGQRIARPCKNARSVLRCALWSSPIVGTRLNRAWFKRRYLDYHGEPLRLDPPVGFNEHIVHRILYERDPIFRRMCDKIAVRAIIRERLGEDFAVPLLGQWADPREIDWEALPERFVLKPNHASGLVAIVHDKATCDNAALTRLAQGWLQRDYYDRSREWGYRGIPRRLVVEPLLVGADGGGAPEAVVLTFGGRAVAIRVLTGIKDTPSRRDNWFDCNGRRLPFHSRKYTLGDFELEPALARRLADAAGTVAEGCAHLRVDFYLTDAGLKIGELTPYHGAGQTPWSLPGCDRLFGRFWRDPSEIDRTPDLVAALHAA